MALRVYRDPDGGEWRVWHVIPDSVSFATLGETYRDGWLCFERVDGTDRRRVSIGLAPVAWETIPEAALDELRRSGEVVTKAVLAGQAGDGAIAGARARAKRRR